MILYPKKGIDQLLFGMKKNQVVAILGKPNKQFKDDDNNVIYLYNNQKLRLTFYEDENFRLGYIITSNPEITLLNKKIIGKNITEIITDLPFKNWETEEYDSTINHFNESNWLTFQSEFDTIIRVEIGALINDTIDEFEWEFNE